MVDSLEQKTGSLPTHSGADRIVGSGTMYGLVCAYDWSATPLGPIAGWSETLVSFVNHVLHAPGPVTMTWGPEYVTFYNDAAIASFGSKHPQALGKPYPVIFSEAWHIVGPTMEACYLRGESLVREDILTPIILDTVIEDKYWSYSRIPLFEHGRVAGVLTPHRDTTATVLARRERDKVAMQMSQFLDVTTDSVVGVDRDWRISYMNVAAEKVYGPASTLVGKNLWEQFPAAAATDSPYWQHYHRAMDQGVSGSFEARYPDPLNIFIEIEVYATPEGIVTFSRDISQKRLSEAALMQSEKLAAVGRMASSIAHEINNPLESVTNLLYIARHSSNTSEIQAMLDMADSELRRVANITNQTLRFHRQSTSPRDITCLDLFSNVLTMYEGKLRNSGVIVEKRKRADQPVRVFEGDIRQVLNNLIGNAVDAMPRGGRLLLRSRESTCPRTGRKGLTLTIADTGTGIPPEVSKRVFEAFYTTKGIGGSGLGLWISRDIVERHEGVLRMRSSQREGHQGTVFTLFLPFEAKIKPASQAIADPVSA